MMSSCCELLQCQVLIWMKTLCITNDFFWVALFCIVTKRSAIRLLAALNLEHAMNITAFPTDFLESGECLFDLFEHWIEQVDKTYHSEQEKMRRFKIFRDMVFRVKELSKIQKSYTHGLTCFADLTPEEIRSNGYLNVKFRNICWRAIYRLNWDVGFLPLELN